MRKIIGIRNHDCKKTNRKKTKKTVRERMWSVNTDKVKTESKKKVLLQVRKHNVQSLHKQTHEM